MSRYTTSIRAHPLFAYFVLAYAFSWIMVALLPVSFIFALLAVFGPTLAALIVTALTDGRIGVGNLLRRVVQWREGIIWYATAIGIPLFIAVLALGIWSWYSGAVFALNSGTSVGLTAVLAALVVGEEIGWRGFALPRLQQRFNGLTASLILGILWAGWHLANGTIPGLQAYWTGFPAFLLFVVTQTIVFTWLANHTHASVLLAWILHASINVTLSLFFLGDQVVQWWLAGLVFGIIALIGVVLKGPNLLRKVSAIVEPASV